MDAAEGPKSTRESQRFIPTADDMNDDRQSVFSQSMAGGKSAGNPYMLMMQNMMNMMMTNPNMQEMMASQLQEMMVNPQMGMMQGGVSFPQTGNFAKPQTKLASETEGEGSHERSAAQSVHRYQSSSLPRAEEEHRPSIVNIAQPPNKNDIAKKIDDMFHEDVDDLDDFYDRYSKVPKAKEYSQVSKPETSHLDRRRQSSGQKDRRDINYLNTGVDSYSRHYQTAGDNYGYRHSAVAEDNELLDTGKPSVLLHVESEMLPFSRNSHDFANNGSNRKSRHQDDYDDYDRETHQRDSERVDLAAGDRQPASRYDRPRAGDRHRGGRRFDGYDDDHRGLSSRDDDYVEARGYGAVDQSEVSRPSNRGGRRHNNYFTDVEARDESRGRSDNDTFKDERPIRRRHEPDVSDLLNAGYGQHSDDQIRGPNRESDDRRLDNSRNNQDNHQSNVTGYINPHDDIPVGGNRKPNSGLGFREPNGRSTEINKSPMTNYEDIPIKRGDPSIYEEAAANPRNIQEAKSAGRQLERRSNRGSPDNEGLAKRSVEQDPADEDDMDYQQPDYIDRPLNDHEAQQLKGGGKDFYQLLEEQLALEGGGGSLAGPAPIKAPPKKHTFLKKKSRPIVPKAGVKPKKAADKKSNDQPKSRDREGSHNASINQSQDAEEETLGGDYNLDRYLKEKDEENSGEVAVYDDKEPWNDDAKDQKDDKVEEESSPKDSAKKSNLLSAYFSSEKTKVADEKKEQKLQAREEEAIAKKYVTSKVDELDKEIKRLKVDRDHVKAKERKLEEEKRKLAKEKEELEAFVKNEKAKVEEYKEQELKKVQNQKKIAERNQKAVMNMPNRKEREEIEALKEKLTKSAEEHNSKEKKLKITIERQKKQIEELLKRNKELEEEVHLLEQMRLKAGGEEKSKVAFKSGPKKNSLEDCGFGGGMVNQRKSSGAEKPKKSAKTSLKSAASNFIEETDDLEDFQRAEDEAVEEVQEMDRSNMVEIDEDNGSQNLGEKGDQQFRMAINPDEYAYSANKFYQEYIQAKSKSKIRLTEERQPKLLATGSDNGKAERKYEDGRVEVTFKNGAIRETFPNGYVIVNYTIGDIKQTLPDGSIIYYYSDQDTTQITLPDNGLNIYRFSSNQVEFHYEDGSKEIKFVDGTEKYIYPNSEEETVFHDGTIQKIGKDKIKTIQYPNGSKDTVHPDGQRVRMFADGRVKRLD